MYTVTLPPSHENSIKSHKRLDWFPPPLLVLSVKDSRRNIGSNYNFRKFSSYSNRLLGPHYVMQDGNNTNWNKNLVEMNIIQKTILKNHCTILRLVAFVSLFEVQKSFHHNVCTVDDLSSVT